MVVDAMQDHKLPYPSKVTLLLFDREPRDFYNLIDVLIKDEAKIYD